MQVDQEELERTRESWIVGIDGSRNAIGALQWAVHQARDRDVRVIAVHAWHLPKSLAVMFAQRGVDVDKMGTEAIAGHAIDEAISSVGGAGTGIESRIVEGHPSASLLDETHDASLLILGRGGHSELKHLILGSVSRYCATHSSVPVVVVPPDWAPGASDEILIGFNGSDNAQAAVRWAIDFANPATPMRALAAIDVAPWLDPESTLERFPHEVEAEQLRISDILLDADPNRRTTFDFALHSAEQSLAEASAQAALLVVGARRRRRHGPRLLGPVGSWLLHDAACPIAIVPHG